MEVEGWAAHCRFVQSSGKFKMATCGKSGLFVKLLYCHRGASAHLLPCLRSATASSRQSIDVGADWLVSTAKVVPRMAWICR
jgi:hypothetical protein